MRNIDYVLKSLVSLFAVIPFLLCTFIFSVSAQVEPNVESNFVYVTIYVNKESFVIYVNKLENGNTISLEGLGFQYADNEKIRYLQDYQFDLVDFWHLQPPICFWLKSPGSTSPPSLNCTEEITFPFVLPASEVFWYDNFNNNIRPIRVFSGSKSQSLIDSFSNDICSFISFKCDVAFLPSGFSGNNSDWTPKFAEYGNGDVKHEMAWVPPNFSRVLLGDNQHQADLPESGYWIDRYEVSAAQFEECINADGCPVIFLEDQLDELFPQKYFPIRYVTPQVANQYCQWAVGGRLPTHDEWEYAAAGPAGWAFPWDDKKDALRGAWYNANSMGDDSIRGPIPVETRLGNEMSWVGALHMSGNVREWAGQSDGYSGRGGYWNNALEDLRISRLIPTSDIQNEVTGFRCVKVTE